MFRNNNKIRFLMTTFNKITKDLVKTGDVLTHVNLTDDTYMYLNITYSSYVVFVSQDK